MCFYIKKNLGYIPTVQVAKDITQVIRVGLGDRNHVVMFWNKTFGDSDEESFIVTNSAQTVDLM